MSRSSRTGLFALTFVGGENRECAVGGSCTSLSADVAVVTDNWSSWVLVRLRGDMLSQFEEFERMQRFRFKDEDFAVDR